MTAVVSKTANALINNFAKAAKIHGWEEDQGSGDAPMRAKRNFQRHYNALVKYISQLETATTVKLP